LNAAIRSGLLRRHISSFSSFNNMVGGTASVQQQPVWHNLTAAFAWKWKAALGVFFELCRLHLCVPKPSPLLTSQCVVVVRRRCACCASL
jgi:hypothetical protein